MSTTKSFPPSPPPHALLAAARAGDDVAFTTIVRRHGPAVMTTCLRWVKDHHLAEDLSQDVFVRLLRSNIQPLDDRELRRWLLQVARNAAIDHHRHEDVVRRSETAASELVVPEAAPQRTVEMRVLIAQVLDDLNDRDAELVVEHYMEDVSLRDMAARRGTTRDTIKVQLHRARSRARAIARDRRIDGLPWLPAPLARWGTTIKGLASHVGAKGVLAVLAPLVLVGGAGLWPSNPRVPESAGQAFADRILRPASASSFAGGQDPSEAVTTDAPPGTGTGASPSDAARRGDRPSPGDAAGATAALPDTRVTIPATDQRVVETRVYDGQEAGTSRIAVLPGVVHEDGVVGFSDEPDSDPETKAAVAGVCRTLGTAEPLVECRQQ